MYVASAKCHDRIVQLLLEKGVDANAEGEDYGKALQEASAGGHYQLVKQLLENGADVNAQGGYYGNALQAASAGCHGLPQAALSGGYTLQLRAASAKGHNQIVQLLLNKGANVNAQGGSYGNAL